MSNAATAPAGPVQLDPDRAVSARLDSAGVGNILRLLHTLVAYGRNLVEKLREEDDPDDLPWYAFLTRIFGTTDPALITVIIIRGLLRAAALQARLSKSFAGDLLPLPLQEDRIVKRIDRGRRRGRGQPRAAGWAIPPGWPAGDPSLDRLPTPEEEMFAEIVEEDRDRPIGAILFDICLDLGIVPDLMDRATWAELRLALTLYGGDPAPLLARAVDSANPAGLTDATGVAAGTPNATDNPSFSPIPAADSPTTDHRQLTTGILYPPWPAPYPHSPAPACTGPP